MSDNQVQRGWVERVVSRERGNCMVHYVVKDSIGNSLLAVVGMEETTNDMVYYVTEHFIRAFGSTTNVRAGTMWTSRKDVVECLALVTSRRGPIVPDINQQITNGIHQRRVMAPMNRSSQHCRPLEEEIIGSRKLVTQNADISWIGDAWTCQKQLNHYPSIFKNRTPVPVYSFVWIAGEEGRCHIAYVEDLFEDPEGEKMVTVCWFLDHEDVQSRFLHLNPQHKEVFITNIKQQISAKCIDSLVAVLNSIDFKKSNDLLPQNLLSKTFLCHREFKNGAASSFNPNSLHGYFIQPILHALKHHMAQPRDNRRNLSERAGASAPQKPPSEGSKRSNDIVLGEDGKGAKSGPIHQKLEIQEPAEGQAQFKINENIELLSQDSGLRSCWFRCKILCSSQQRLKVQYYDIDHVGGTGKLKEWVPANRVAAPDNLGIRCAGRLTIRPWPDWDSSDVKFEVGTAADAWWCDAWWEGIIIGCDPSSKDKLQLYCPGENKFLAVKRKDIRLSKDWIGNSWVNVKAKPDIFSLLSTFIKHPMAKPPPLSLLPAATTNNSAHSSLKAGQPHEPQGCAREQESCGTTN